MADQPAERDASTSEARDLTLRVWRGDASGGEFVDYTVPVEELPASTVVGFKCRLYNAG